MNWEKFNFVEELPYHEPVIVQLSDNSYHVAVKNTSATGKPILIVGHYFSWDLEKIIRWSTFDKD